jgi:MYXO-CTERM domain-containing protein
VKTRSLLAWGALSSLVTGVTPSFGAPDASVPDSGTAPHMDAGSGGAIGTDSGSPVPPVLDASVDSGPVVSHPSIPVGKACVTAADCAAGLICIPSTSDALGGGGPPGGLCTVDCSKNGQADCDAVDPGSFCGASDADGKIAHCFETCEEGPPLGDAVKCHNRPDVACAPDGQGNGYCAPTCRGNSDCGKRQCNPLTGLCQDSVPGTLSTGAQCDSTAAKNDCFGGACSQYGGGDPTVDNSSCSAVCALGVPGACGTDPDPNSKQLPDAACLPLVADGLESIGDIGGCVQLCDCDTDCRNKSFVCQTVSPLSGLGRGGLCVPGKDGTGAVVKGTACGAGSSAGGATGAGGKSGTSSSGGRGTETSDAGAPAAKSNDSSGCGCRVESNAPSGSDGGRGALALAALGLALLRRRRGAR